LQKSQKDGKQAFKMASKTKVKHDKKKYQRRAGLTKKKKGLKPFKEEVLGIGFKFFQKGKTR